MAARLSPVHLPGKVMVCICDNQGTLPQTRVETLISLQAEFEIKRIPFYQIIVYYNKYSKLNLPRGTGILKQVIK